jgi:aspartyl-tRNA synthetase
MLLSRTSSLREVIAFPKSGGGFDPLTQAPAPITAQQRREAGVDAPPPKPADTQSTDTQSTDTAD